MNFKTRMKKMNRGIALGVIIIVVLIIYIIIDSVRFNQSKDDIESVADNYVQAFAKASESDIEGFWKKDDEVKYEEGISKVIDEYWSDASVSTDVLYGYDSKSNLKEYIGGIEYSTNYIGNLKGMQYDLTKVKIKKYGPGGAMLTGTIVMTGSVPMYDEFAYLGGYCSTNEITWDEMISKHEDGKIKAATVDISADIETTIIFTYEDGKWKICNQSMYVMEGSVGKPYDEEVIEIGGSADGNNAEGSSTEDRKSE